MIRRLCALVALSSCFLFQACAAGSELEAEDGEHDVGLGAGKSDGTGWTECELREIVSLANAPDTTLATLRSAGVPSRSAQNLISARPFADAQAIDDVPYVGPMTFRRLVEAVADRCATPPPAEDDVSVVFSPQPLAASHLVRVAGAIDRAERSIDVAMYSFGDAQIMGALERAAQRGVSIRFLYDGASAERSMPAGSRSERLERAGIEVRWINKVMHHKFAIVDGVRTSAGEARDATLITGSANWSNSAATRYDENTVLVRGSAELALRFQREFDLLWGNGRPFPGREDIATVQSLAITDEMIDAVDDPSIDAVYTSANFETSISPRFGPTFSVVAGRSAVSDRLVAIIEGATRSIHLASGHLRSRPVVEALLARHAADPSIDIRVYLDQQEYISETGHRLQEEEQQECLAAATGSEARTRACMDRDFLYSYAVSEAGIALRFKTFAYRWDHSYAEQMHHKYLVVDGRTLVSGSYNLSDNAEHATMENIVVWEGDQHAPLIEAFEANFEAMWVTGIAEERHETLLADIADGDGFPLVFAPMALDWTAFTALRRTIRDACPLVDDPEFRSEPAAHRRCP
jgi:phosphatidylserine/phosphatidylglycerophosphate/cardiolipin synthase-like enzyme